MKGYFVYFLYDSDKNLLYIGKTTSLRTRLSHHFSKETDYEWKQTVDKENIIVFKCENGCDLDVYETYFINKYYPKYNKDKVFNSSLSFELLKLEPIYYNFHKEKTLLRNSILKDIRRYLHLKNLPSLMSYEILELEDIKKTHFILINSMVDVLGADKINSLGSNFKDYIESLQSIYSSKLESNLLSVDFIFNLYPWLLDLINKVGFINAIKLIEQENYHTKNITRKSEDCLSHTVYEDIYKILDTKPEINVKLFIGAKRLKDIFKEIYQNLEISRTAKGSDIEEFYKVHQRNKRLKGVLVKGYILLERRINPSTPINY